MVYFVSALNFLCAVGLALYSFGTKDATCSISYKISASVVNYCPHVDIIINSVGKRIQICQIFFYSEGIML